MSNQNLFSKNSVFRTLLFLLCASVLFLSSACTETPPTKENASEPFKETEANKPEETTTFTTGETAAFENLKITANELKEVKKDETGFISAEEGKTFTGINFTVENISQETQTVSSLLLFEAYADGTKCEFSFSAAAAFPDGTLDGDIAPGKKMTGWYSVEIPENWSELELHIADSWISDNKAVFVFKK